MLLVEDDPEVRGLFSKFLEAAGYTVIEATDGRDALDTFEARGADIDLVVTDVVMPNVSGPALTSAIRARRPDVAGRVHLHGYLPEAEKNAIVSGARLNVTASEFEGWGLTVIEAAALGIPTVAYDVPGLRDSVRDGVTGWLVKEGERLADVVDRALEELSDPQVRERMSRACRMWAQEFTWGKTGATIAALITAKLDETSREKS